MSEQFQQSQNILPHVKYTIAVSSGKGGVGKSTVAVNLAAALADEGFKVGLIDADIYGPSIPMMLDVKEKPMLTRDGDTPKLLPVLKYSIKLMSIGFLMDEKEAVIWRGPMASTAFRQFMQDVEWGELDFLLYDMPPGTGDIQLTLTQLLPLTGAVIVTTPQDISLIDARKGAKMYEKVEVPVLGIIENMSYYLRPDGSKDHIFGEGGGKRLSDEMDINYLGEIPINTDIRIAGDEGKPIVLKDKNSAESKKFREIALKLNEIAESIGGKSKIEISL